MNSNEFESYLTASQVEMYRNLVVSAQSALLAKTTFVIDHNLIAKQAVDQAQATINAMGYGYHNYPIPSKLTLQVTAEELQTLTNGIKALSDEGSLPNQDTKEMLELLKISK